MISRDDDSQAAVIRGEFFSDGEKFVFRMAGTPFSGIGNTASAAFEDLMRVDAQTTPLSALINERARDLEGEVVRATTIRMVMLGLIVFAILAGAIVGTAAVLPRVVADVGRLTVTHLVQSVDNMTPDQEAQFSRVVDRLNGFLNRGVSGCAAKPGSSQP